MGGFFEFYSLNSIGQRPKSGYDILKEIREKSRGNILASKGTIYPMLDSLEVRRMVKADHTYARGRKVFSLTAEGKTYLGELGRRERGIRKKMRYMPFLFADFKGVHSGLDCVLFRLFVLADECPKKNRTKVKSLLDDCRKEIEALE
jgi:DNA-binding PadR family transcriptional regulator